MRNRFRTILLVMLAMLMALCLGACGSKTEPAETTEENNTEAVTEEAAEPEQDEEELPEVVKTIEGVDDPETLGSRVPLMIDSITLYEDGSLAIVPTEDLKKNEIKDDADAVYPFEESGKVKDVWVVDYGNGGYRTIAALMEDGSISVANGRALVEDHIFAVMDDVANRDNFVDLRNDTGEDGSAIIGITEDGDEVILDYSLNFDEPEE